MTTNRYAFRKETQELQAGLAYANKEIRIWVSCRRFWKNEEKYQTETSG